MCHCVCQVFFFYNEAAPSLTIIVPVQTLECQPQLLLMFFQIFAELVEVQAPIFVLISRRHYFLQRGDTIYGLFVLLWLSQTQPACHTVKYFMQNKQAKPWTPVYPQDPHEFFTCAAPCRNIPIALRCARNSATSTLPSLLVSSLSNKSWYDFLLSASQHRAFDSKSVRNVWYIVRLMWKQQQQQSRRVALQAGSDP